MANQAVQVRQVALKYGLDPHIFKALVRQESGGRQGAHSPVGAIGLTQLMPGTAASLGVNPYNATQNLEGGAKYLSQQLHRFGNYREALAAYNAGPGAVEKYNGVPPFAETQNYVNTILSGQNTSRVRNRPGISAPRFNSQTEPVQTMPVDTTNARRAAAMSFLASGGIKNSTAVQALAATIGALRQQANVPAVQQPQQQQAPAQPGAAPRGGFHGSKVFELIHNDGGGSPGYGIKNGQVVNGSQVFSAVWAGHENHVHVAADPRTVVALGKLAQRMGLHVGENPHFGGVTQGAHVAGSYHYKGEAIDVSGDAKLMDRYARAVERYNRTGALS